jgi:hypothetical protein
MYKALPLAAIAMLCLSQPLPAQQGYEFLQRDNPYGLQSDVPQGAGELAFCWSDVGGRTAYVTNIFPHSTDTKEMLVSMLQQNKRGYRFTCEFGTSPSINQFAVRKTSELAAQANVEQLGIGKVR